MKSYKSLFLFVLLVGISFTGNACGVCGQSFSDEEVSAYRTITAFMVLIPVGLLTFLGYWGYKKYITEAVNSTEV